MRKPRNPLLNTFPNNPTQTDLLRFKRTPTADIHTPFTETAKRFGDWKNKGLPNIFDKGIGK